MPDTAPQTDGFGNTEFYRLQDVEAELSYR